MRRTVTSSSVPFHYRSHSKRLSENKEEQIEKMARCIALTKQNKQCRNNAKEGTSFCNVHQAASYCTGVTLKGEPCKAQRFLDTLFCKHHQHQPKGVSTDCELLRVPDLLEKKRAVVLDYRDYVDAYTSEDIFETRGLNLDHVVELHLFRDCYDSVEGTNEQKQSILTNLRSISNITLNLNFTTQSINQKKHCAFKSFCDDYSSGTPHLDGLQYYLSRTSLNERINVSIVKEVAWSVKGVLAQLNSWDNCEDLITSFVCITEKMNL